MNNREWAILDALNIASTIHQDHRGFGATAEQISEVLRADERLAEDYPYSLRSINARSMLMYLAQMAGARKGTTDRMTGFHFPLVEKVGGARPARYRMTDWALKVVTA
jgi:hypothetical protein